MIISQLAKLTIEKKILIKLNKNSNKFLKIIVNIYIIYMKYLYWSNNFKNNSLKFKLFFQNLNRKHRLAIIIKIN